LTVSFWIHLGQCFPAYHRVWQTPAEGQLRPEQRRGEFKKLSFSLLRSLIVILLVKILEFIHVLLLNTIDLAILVVHFPGLPKSAVVLAKSYYRLPGCVIFSTLDPNALIKDVLIRICFAQARPVFGSFESHTIGAKFSGVCVVEDARVGAMGDNVDILQHFVGVMRFVVEKAGGGRSH
jgi:hypothetical protein